MSVTPRLALLGVLFYAGMAAIALPWRLPGVLAVFGVGMLLWYLVELPTEMRERRRDRRERGLCERCGYA